MDPNADTYTLNEEEEKEDWEGKGEGVREEREEQKKDGERIGQRRGDEEGEEGRWWEEGRGEDRSERKGRGREEYKII